MLALRLLALSAVVLLASRPNVPGQTYEVLHTFTGTGGDGSGPRGTLVRVGGDLYGTTSGGGDTSGLARTAFFGDVLCPSLFADWIEQLYTEGITAGCS